MEASRIALEAVTQERNALLEEVERLKALLSGASQAPKSLSEDNVAGINTLADELEFWKTLASQPGMSERQRKRVSQFVEKLEAIASDVSNIKYVLFPS